MGNIPGSTTQSSHCWVLQPFPRVPGGGSGSGSVWDSLCVACGPPSVLLPTAPRVCFSFLVGQLGKPKKTQKKSQFNGLCWRKMGQRESGFGAPCSCLLLHLEIPPWNLAPIETPLPLGNPIFPLLASPFLVTPATQNLGFWGGWGFCCCWFFQPGRMRL